MIESPLEHLTSSGTTSLTSCSAEGVRSTYVQVGGGVDGAKNAVLDEQDLQEELARSIPSLVIFGFGSRVRHGVFRTWTQKTKALIIIAVDVVIRTRSVEQAHSASHVQMAVKQGASRRRSRRSCC